MEFQISGSKIPFRHLEKTLTQSIIIRFRLFKEYNCIRKLVYFESKFYFGALDITRELICIFSKRTYNLSHRQRLDFCITKYLLKYKQRVEQHLQLLKLLDKYKGNKDLSVRFNINNENYSFHVAEGFKGNHRKSFLNNKINSFPLTHLYDTEIQNMKALVD